MRRLAFLLAVVPSLAPLAAAQDRGDPRSTIEKYERFLDRKPFNDRAFDQMVTAAVSINALDELIERYRGRLEQGAGLGPRVILARLLARGEEHEEALLILKDHLGEDGVGGDARVLRIVGHLELERGRTKQAVDYLDRAAAGTEDRDLLEEIHTLRGEAWLSAGDRAKAAAAFHDLAELEPDSFPLRLDAADALSRHGLHEQALIEFQVAVQLAEGDSARRCRVLADIGKLHEALAHGEEALAVYREAIGLMSRGHWLKEDLYTRILALHRRTGQIDLLLDRAAEDVTAAPGDLDAREFQARVLVSADRKDEAREVLASATVEFPSDLDLGRRLISLLRDLEDQVGVVAEYQRLLEQHPGELELYLELGQTFAASGKLEQAARQWQQTLEQRLDDANLCVRLAGLYALYDQPNEAVQLFEKAISLEPAELRHYADLASYLRTKERVAEASAVLVRAEEASAGNAVHLADVVSLWREHRDLDRARATLDKALALEPDDPHLHYRLADLQLAQEETEVALETLHHVLHLTDEGNLRRTAAERILRIFLRSERMEELIALETAAIEADATDPIPHVILGRAYVALRQPDLAEEHYTALLKLEPEREDARVSLAQLAEQRSDFAGALAHYEALMEARPQARRRWLDRVARVHLARYDQDKAFACYQEILAGAPNNPAAFKEVAASYQRLGLIDEAADCLRQAVRLEPEDHRSRLQLADLYRQLGELHSAEREVLAAMESDDERVVADARTAYYELLSAAGRVTSELKTLRTRVEENPYDVEAPLTLVDIYVREFEYELALDVLDRLISYQPEQVELLEERGRLLGLLERFDEAIEVYESLWKMKGVDREDVALSIADAALEEGDLEKAAEVLSTVSSVGRVARLYRKKERWDEAIDVLERGISRSPGDRHLLSSLADLHQARGDEDSAIAVLERSNELLGDSFSRLEQLGQLYNTVGRRDDASACGQRLFLLIREVEDEAEDPDAEERGKPTAPQRRTLSWWNVGRVSDVRTYFRGLGLLEEFAEIGASEVLLQPTNHSLFTTVLSELSNLEGEGARALELISAVRAATLDRGRIPEGYSPGSWARSLDSQRVNLYRRDVPFADQRIATLSAAHEDGSAKPNDYEEWARIQDMLTRPGEKLAALASGVARFPEDSSLRAGLASTLYGEKRYGEALPHYAELVRLTEANAPDPSEELFNREFNFRRSKWDTLQAFPRHVRRNISEDDLRAFYELTLRRPLNLSWGPGTQQFPAAAHLAHARCLGKAGDKAGARAVLSAMAAEADNRVLDLTTIADALDTLDLFDDARAIYERLAARERELSNHPVFGFNRSWARSFDAPMSRLARIHERRGEAVEAYHLLRTYGDAAAGELALTSGDAVEVARDHYAAEVARLQPALDADPKADSDPWRDACVRLAEVQQIAKRWDDALAMYQTIAQRRPSDFPILEQIAALHLRAGRIDETIEVHRAIIERKRELNLRPMRAERPSGRILTPIAPPRPPERNWAWSNLRNSYYSRGPQPNYPYRENYVEILKHLLDRGRVEEATEVMRDLARTDVQTFAWLGYSLAEVIEAYQLGADGIPILRLIHSHNPSYASMTVQFAQALIAGQRWDEARRVLLKLRDGNGSRTYAGTQARTLLETLDAREGIDSRQSIEDLLAEVEADPRSSKARLEYARRLLDERRFEEALEHALVAEELAPHKDEVEQLALDLLQLSDRTDELERRLLEDLDSVSDDRLRLENAARVATWMWDRGEEAEAEALLLRATNRSSRGYPYYTAAGFFLQRGDLDKALAIVTTELERTPKHRQASIKRSKSAIERALGDVLPLLDDAWEDGFEKAAAEGDKSDVLRQLATPMRGDPRIATQGDAWIERFTATHAGLRGQLYAAAVALCAGDLAGVEERLAVLADPTGDTRFLYPLLVTLARTREDLPKALAILEGLYERGVGSESALVQTSVGQLSERGALRAEIGSLRLELGDREGALAIWDEMYDEEEDTGKRRLAELYRKHDLTAEAATYLRAYLDEVGERNETDLTLLGDFELELGNVEGAIAIWKRSLILAKDNEHQQTQLTSRLLDGYRRLGRIPEYAAELEAQVTADPNDIALAKRHIRVVAESGDHERAYALLEDLRKLPEQETIVLPVLIQRAKLAGDVELAIDLTRQMMESSTDQYQRRNNSRNLATLLFAQDRDAEALEALQAAFEDPEAPDALFQIAYRLRYMDGREEEALAMYLAALKLNPNQSWQWTNAFQLLAQLERYDEQIELIWEKLNDEHLRSHTSTFVSSYVSVVDKIEGERERLAGELAQHPTDRVLLMLSASLALADDRSEDAIAHYETLADALPGDPEPLQLLLAIHDSEDQVDEALVILDRLIDLSEVEQGISLKRSSGNLSSYRQQRSKLLLRREDIAAAEASLTDTRGNRYLRPSVSSWRHGSLRREPNSQRLDFWSKLEEWDKVLELYETEPRVSTGMPWDQRWYEARLRSGEEEAVLEELWRRVADPAEDLFQQGGGSSKYMGYSGYGYGYGGGLSSFGGMGHRGSTFEQLLVQFHSERGTMDTLRQLVEGALRRNPKHGSLKNMLHSLIQREEQWTLLLPEAEEQLAEDPWDENAINRVVELYFQLGRYEESVPLLEQVLRQSQAAILDSVTGWSWHSWERTSGPVRFTFASSSGRMGYGSSYSSYNSSSGWGGAADHARRRLIVALRKTGQLDRAVELEARELEGRRAQGLDGAEPDSALPPLFVAAELYEEAEQIRLAQLEERIAGIDPEEEEDRAVQEDSLRGNVYETLAAMWRGAGDEERAVAYAKQRLEVTNREIARTEAKAAERGDDPTAWSYGRRADLRARLLGDLVGARADLERYDELIDDPDEVHDTTIAWTWYRVGDPARAARIFENEVERRRYRWYDWSADIHLGLRLAQAAAGEELTDLDRRTIRRALFQLTDNEFEAQARELLGESE